MTKHKKIKVGITSGDINGIGIEVSLKALSDSRVYEKCTPIIYASKNLISAYEKEVKMEGIHFKVIKSAEEADPKKINVVNCLSPEVKLELGTSTKEGGAASLTSLQSAVEDIASNKIDVLVTAPINKNNIQSDDFAFPGHTEYLANYANEDHPLMILAHDDLRVALVTGHIALNEVSSKLTSDLILSKIRVLNKSLKQDFGIHRPRIAVLGLNPHNGDKGLMGDEEETIVAPAVEKAVEENILAFGPFPADGFFGSPGRRNFDAVLALYHDQGLAPFKAMAFDEGVNFTAGLPIVRTSPDHGVAYDIAGKGLASETSMRQAIRAACDIYLNRKAHRDLTSNVLEVSKKK